MARVISGREGRLVATQFTPVKGVVTEFTPTMFPADAAIDADNLVFDVDGSVRRRPGLNFETQYSINPIDSAALTEAQKDSYAVTTALWKSVSNSGTLNIIVVQIGLVLQFYAQIGSVSANFLGEIDISTSAIDAGEAITQELQFASGIGNLYVVGQYMKPLRIQYIPTVPFGAPFGVATLTLKIRDFDGVDDNLGVQQRPSYLTFDHYYNLLNQGWTHVGLAAFGFKNGGVYFPIIDPIKDDEEALKAHFMAGFSDNPLTGGFNSGNEAEVWPSNADQMQLGFTTDASGNPDFDSNLIIKNTLPGNTPAPKGHFILDAFNQDREDAVDNTSAATLPTLVFPTRPETVAFHNGKLFMSQPILSNKPSGIYYSQTLTDGDKANNMHSEADPTAEEINDLVATDGGFITAPGVGQIYKLAEMGNGVIVGASNGIWYLTGADVDSGFTATSNRLFKVSDTGMLSQDSYVEAENAAYYWSAEGIMTVTIAETGLPVVQNLSERTIQSRYINISSESRRNAKGVYVGEQRKVYWAYTDALASETPEDINFNSVLILDLNIGGFYFYSIGQSTGYPEIRGLTFVAPLADVTNQEALTTTSGETIYLLDGTTIVESETQERTAQITQLKLLTFADSVILGGWGITFSEFNDRTFHDWRFFDSSGKGLNYSSFIEFGYNTFGANHTRGQATWVHSFFSTRSKNLAPGGYYELPPAAVTTDGFRVSQSVLEILHKADPELFVSQSLLEVLHKADSSLRVTQTVIEVIQEV